MVLFLSCRMGFHFSHCPRWIFLRNRAFPVEERWAIQSHRWEECGTVLGWVWDRRTGTAMGTDPGAGKRHTLVHSQQWWGGVAHHPSQHTHHVVQAVQG